MATNVETRGAAACETGTIAKILPKSATKTTTGIQNRRSPFITTSMVFIHLAYDAGVSSGQIPHFWPSCLRRSRCSESIRRPGLAVNGHNLRAVQSPPDGGLTEVIRATVPYKGPRRLLAGR